MSLLEEQIKFTRDFFQFGNWVVQEAEFKGYACVLEECYRNPNCSHGHAKSLHKKKLAGHILLFRKTDEGYVFLTRTSDYEWLGERWESLDPRNAWGGHFNDGNHFSRTYRGMR